MNIFICQVPFHYYSFKNVYKHLENSYFIIPPLHDRVLTNEYGGGMSGNGVFKYVEDFLQRKGIEVIDYGDRTQDNLAEYLNKNASNVIVSHWFDGIYLLNNVRIVRLMYGLGNKKSVEGDYVKCFIMDLILTYGPSSVSRFGFDKQGLVAQPVGNPIFDDWFNDEVNEDEVKFVKKRLDSKPTVLYLPTFKECSSFEKFFDSIIKLSGKFNTIVKLHHASFTGEANRLCRLLSNTEIIVLSDYIDPQPLYKLADIVLVDNSENSGAVYDCLLLKKPLIVLGTSLEGGGYTIYNKIKGTCSVKISDLVPSIDNPNELEKLISENIGKEIHLDNNIIHSLFLKADGNAGKRAADIIMDETKYPMVPTIKKYERAIENAPDEEKKELIINIRNNFLPRVISSYSEKKPIFLKRVLNRLSF